MESAKQASSASFSIIIISACSSLRIYIVPCFVHKNLNPSCFFFSDARAKRCLLIGLR